MVEGKAWPCAYVELGSPGLPHAVVPYPGLADADPQALFQLGKAMRSHPAFPKGANVNFYEPTGPDQVLSLIHISSTTATRVKVCCVRHWRR